MYSGQPNHTESAVLPELNRTDLHVDTELTVADVPHPLTTTTTNATDDVAIVALFDVYNNGRHAGGRLRVHHDRIYSYSPASGTGALSASLSDRTPKYVRRMDLSDLTLRVGTVYQINDNRPLTSAAIIDHLMSENNTQFDVLNRPTFQMAMHVQQLLGYRCVVR